MKDHNIEKVKVYLSAREVAQRYNVSESTLEKWRYKHKGPSYVKICGTIMYSLEDLYAYEEQNKINLNDL